MPLDAPEYFRLRALADFGRREAKTLSRNLSTDQVRDLLPRNPMRAGLIIYNAGTTVPALVGFGEDNVGAAEYAERIAPTDRMNFLHLDFLSCPKGRVTALGDGGTTTVMVTEWSLSGASADEFNLDRLRRS